MKKTVYFSIAALLLASCSGSNKPMQSLDSDSALTSEMESPVGVPSDYTLSRDSIGPVRVGEAVSSLAPAVPDLYDMMLTTETPDAMAYSFLLGDVPQFTIYDFMDGKVDVIALEGNARGVAVSDGQIRVGDPFKKVFGLPGVESEWEGFDDGGIWYWKWNGLFFGVDETGISEKLGDALCNEKRPPRGSDFTDGVKIGYIATGLPF